jgi:hypothetical protein
VGPTRGSLDYWYRCGVRCGVATSTGDPSLSQNPVSEFSRDPNRPPEKWQSLAFVLLRYEKAVVVVVMLHEEGSLPVQVLTASIQKGKAIPWRSVPCVTHRQSQRRLATQTWSRDFLHDSFPPPPSITSKKFPSQNIETKCAWETMLNLKEVAGGGKRFPNSPQGTPPRAIGDSHPPVIFHDQSPAVNYRVGVPAPA